MVDNGLMRPLKLKRAAIRIFHFFPLASPRERDESERRLGAVSASIANGDSGK